MNKLLMGKRVLIVDDEKDILDTLIDLLDMCKIDTALSYGEAEKLLKEADYDAVVLDIMGVDGYKLLEIANDRKIPALMLTAHALDEENLIKSAENGAAYFVPKDEMEDIETYISDVLEALEMKKNTWVRWYDRFGGYFDKKFHGTDWREKENSYWAKYLKQHGV